MEQLKVIKSKFLKNMFDQNTYVLISGDDAIIIDAGAELEDVKACVNGKNVLAVLLTHLHFDHTWNIEDYVKEFNCDVYVVENQENRFLDVKLNASFMVRQNITKNVAKNNIKYYAENLKIGNFELKIIFTPGHTADGVCVLWQDKLFTGDTIFADGVGRCDLYDSNSFEMKNSLQKLVDIDFSVAYPGHYEAASKDKILTQIAYYV